MSILSKLTAKTAFLAGLSLLCLVAMSFGPLDAQAQDANLGQKKFAAIEDEILDIMEDREEGGWASHLKEDGTSRSKRINRMKRQVIEILAETKADHFFQAIENNRQEVIRTEQKLAELKTELASAPRAEDVAGFSIGEIIQRIFGRTKQDVRDDIGSAEENLTTLADDRERLKDQLLVEINAIGLSLNRDDLDGLLNTVTANSIIEMHAVYMSMKAIQAQLELALGNSNESIDVARRYYGIYTVLLETGHYMHTVFLGDLEEHDEKLVDIIEQAKSLRSDSQGMIVKNRGNGDLVRVLEANKKSQELTIRAGRAYRDYLRMQNTQIKAARAQLGRQVDVAVNTYKTVTLSSALLEIMRSQTRNFETLLNLEVPDLTPFKNRELEEEFNRLNSQLKG